MRVDRTKEIQLLNSQQLSLHVEDSLGAPGIQLPQKECRATWCRFPFVSLGKSTKSSQILSREARDHQPQLLPTSSTTPWSSSPGGARVQVTPSTPVTATPGPPRRGPTARRAPKRFISVVSIMVISIQGAGAPGFWHSLGRSWAPSAWNETLSSHVTFVSETINSRYKLLLCDDSGTVLGLSLKQFWGH